MKKRIIEIATPGRLDYYHCNGKCDDCGLKYTCWTSTPTYRFEEWQHLTLDEAIKLHVQLGESIW